MASGLAEKSSPLTAESPSYDGSGPLSADAGKHQWSRETWIALFAILGILAHLAARYALNAAIRQAAWPLLAVLVIGGGPLLFDLLRRLTRGEFGSDLLAGISIAVSVVLGQYLAGSIIVLMLAGGTALEQYAMRRASSVLAALSSRLPRIAHKQRDSELVDIGLDEVRVGDRLVVFPHEICPVDGVITEGRGTMDESYLTGEPFHIAKVPGSEVLSGAVNGETSVTLSVVRLPVDSRYAKIMQVMHEAETHRPRIRRVADRLGAWYTLLGLSVAALAWLLGHDPTRFLAVLVIATPCPLLLAIPVAIIGAISVAASRGIIIRDPSMLERISSCTTVIFDKTGTLTYGKPALTEIVCAADFAKRDVLRMAASLEQYSKHPLARSILEAAREENIELAPVSSIGEKPGHGLIGSIGTALVQITGRSAVPDPQQAGLPSAVPGMECVLLVNGAFAAVFRFHDEPRTDSSAFIDHLGPRHRVNKVMLLSGDREAEVRYLAARVGIDEVHFGKSPEDKIAIVRAEAAKSPTLFLGDGINDAPAMQAATVGVAFGQHSDITSEAADAVVLEASLGRVDELIHIGRRMRAIGLQSAIGGMALSVVGMGLAAAGLLPPIAGAIAQEIIDAAAVLNALRMVLPASDIRDAGL